MRSPGRATDDEEADGELVRSPQEHLHAFLRSLDAQAEGLPDALRRAAAPGAAPLRDREPRPHAGAGGGVLPPVPGPAARPAPCSAPCSRSSTVGSSRRTRSPGFASPDFRAALDRLAAATDGRDPVIADLARQVRFAYFDEPVIAAARDRGLCGGGRRPRSARSRTPSAPTATRGSPPSSPARSRSPRRSSAAWQTRSRPRARAAGGDRPPLLPHAHARAVRRDDPSTAIGSSPRATEHEGRPRHLATAFVDLAELPAVTCRRRRLGRGAARR